MNKTEEKIIEIISKQIKIEPSELDLDSNPVEKYNIDSLDFVEMLIDLEDEFGIDLKSSPDKKIESVRDLIREVQEALKEKNA
jgi:acyl carrier protein